MRDAVARAWPHVLLAAAVSGVLLPGLGWRHLWNDEVDTAELARSVVAHGLPTFYDQEGRLSVNNGGREVEDSELVRCFPWAQFYVAAPGVLLAKVFGTSPDAGVRLPFVLLHGVTSGLASHGLVAAGLSTPAALVVGAVLGLQSVRMVFNRQARYPALLDALLVAGMVAIGRWRRGRAGGAVLVACVFLLPQVHPLGGLAMAGMLAGMAALVAVQRGAMWRSWSGVALLPLVASAGCLVLLTRPWRQTAWGTPGAFGFRGLDHTNLSWALLFAALCAGGLLWARDKVRATALVAWMVMLVAGVRVLDFHPVSASRYYVHAVALLVLWPVVLGLEDMTATWRRAWAVACVVFLGAPDVQIALRGGGHLGLALVAADARYQAEGAEQPLQQVVRHIREHGGAADPVLIDVVPQFVNWYLPGHPLALVPDVADRNVRNADNPMWAAVPPMPRWHAWYPTWGVGFWSCHGACDVTVERAEGVALDGPYTLVGRRRGERVLMCPVIGFETTRLLNAPYEYLFTGNTSPLGHPSDLLVLARPCADLAGPP